MNSAWDRLVKKSRRPYKTVQHVEETEIHVK
jgi:hypothetical protein